MERAPLAIQVMPLTSDFDILLSADESIGVGDKVGKRLQQPPPSFNPAGQFFHLCMNPYI
jgi:hypothetical protein